MQPAFRVLALAMLIAPSACVDSPIQRPEPREVPTAPARALDLGTFLADGAIKLLSDRDKAEAASAQFYALQYGRTGAPRLWTGGGEARGEVVVGPPVSVNRLYCRSFAHTVTAGDQSLRKDGMACREEDGTWAVAS